MKFPMYPITLPHILSDFYMGGGLSQILHYIIPVLNIFNKLQGMPLVILCTILWNTPFVIVFYI
jgi:hypothetical protein